MHGINPKDSLDFEYCEDKALKTYNPSKILRYKDSTRLEKIKNNFEQSNKLADIEELEEKARVETNIVDSKLK